MSVRSTKPKRVLLFLRQYRREIQQAIHDYAQVHRWNVEFHPHLPTDWRGDGIIVDRLHEGELEQLRGQRRTPVVARFAYEGPRIGLVQGDVDAIAEMGVNYFARRGFRNMVGIAVMSWPRHVDPCRRFVDRAQQAGYNSSHFCYGRTYGDYDFQAAVATTRKFLRTLDKPCAAFLGGMHCANIVYRACELEGISIPNELSILTNDDDVLTCEAFRPQLSGISGEIIHIGLAMAKMLHAMMANPSLNPPPALVAPEKIVQRQSTDVLAVSHLPTARAINFIFQNYSKLIGIQEVSRFADVSPNALQKYFREHVGKVPSDFLREVRMNRAKELLDETDLTLEQIAKQIGYSCAMSFYTAFKRLFRMTPGAYRALNNIASDKTKELALQK